MSAHNWCFASSRDRFVSGAACPGNASASARPPRPGSPSAASSVRPPSGDRDGRVSEADVEEWAAFMKSKGVSRVVCLLTGSELLSYDEGGLLAFLDRHFTRVVAVPDISGPSSRSQLLDALREAEEAGDHVVVHCSAGIARTGIVLALWLHHRYGVPVQDAVNEVTTHAAEHGATRKPASSGVLRILGKSEGATASGLPPRRGGSLSARSGSSVSSKMASDSGSLTSRRVPPEGVPPMTARGFHTPRMNGFMSVAPSNSSSSAITPTPRSSRPLPKPRVAFVQTGGTIDKEYPKSTGGYAFEIAADCPAARRVIADASHVPLGMHVEYHTACTKDSTEITDEDRAELARVLSEDVATNRVVVTHGTDTMIDTGSFLARDPRLNDMVIVLTGSMRPQKFRDTDAAFNIGVAVGAVHVLTPGVFVCMGGCVISHERCRRDMKTGAFVAVP